MSNLAASTIPPIVGMGASAGGLEALQQFFSCMSSNSGLAYVVIQHLSPDHKSLMAEILGKMVAADVIVLATPVYFYSMCGQLKTMIDRTVPRYTEMKNKEFYFIATAAENDERIMGRIVANFMGFLDCLENPTVKGTLFCGGVWHVGDIKGNPALQQAREMGKNA